MNSLKTIKIAVLSGLMLNLAMPMQAGIKELMKRDLHPVRTLGITYGMAALGAGIGYKLGKNKKINADAKKDNAKIQNIVQRLETNFVVINDNIDELTSLRQIDRDWIKQQISSYHESLRFAGQDPRKLEARNTLLQGLKGNQSVLQNRSSTWAMNGAVVGMVVGALSVVTIELLNRWLNPKK